MKKYTDTSEIDKNKVRIATVGTFDGVHEGHLNILNLLIEKAKDADAKSILITFNPHPRTVVSEEFKLELLTTLDEKVELLNKFGVDEILVINFTKEFSQLTYEEFIKKIIVDKIGASHVIIGHDHKFGKDRGGNEESLRELAKKMNFEVSAVEARKIKNEIISSTKIRKVLNEGNIELANSYLGWKYYFSGKVVKGAERGRQLGFPTANIEVADKNKLIPKSGVYAVKCRIGDKDLKGVMNIGNRPTFNDVSSKMIEIHLFNFSDFIYGETMEIEFAERIRDEKKFDSKEELIAQIKNDKKSAEKILINN